MFCRCCWHKINPYSFESLKKYSNTYHNISSSIKFLYLTHRSNTNSIWIGLDLWILLRTINTRILVSRLNFTNVHFMKLTDMCRFYEFMIFKNVQILWFWLNLNCDSFAIDLEKYWYQKLNNIHLLLTLLSSHKY